MAQHDYIISNQTFPNTRADINNLAEAVATNNSGTSAPTTQYAGQFWIDTTTTTWTLYIHDGTDDIQFATIDTSANTVNFIDSALDVVTDTTPQLGGDLDLNSNDITGTGNINITGTATVSGDLTVDTNTLYVDSSNNRVGLFNTSPQVDLDIKKSGFVVAKLHNYDGTNPSDGVALDFLEGSQIDNVFGGASTYGFRLKLDGATNSFIIKSGNQTTINDRFAIQRDTGNVGIGTSSPNVKLEIYDADPYIRLTDSVAPTGYSQVMGTYQGGLVLSADTSNSVANSLVRFDVDGSERMRIDSSGNVLVGKTTTDFGTAGILTAGSGSYNGTRSGKPMSLNRLGSDGEILEFYKDSTSVGSIRADNNTLSIDGASNRSGIRFANAILQPKQNGAIVDNTVNLGTSGERFKNLYLGGNIYLGGTGSANALSDYEEGTWTPTVVPNTSGTVSLSIANGIYTKIGNFAHFEALIVVSSISSPTGYFQIQGLPFVSNAGARTAGSIVFFHSLSNNVSDFMIYNNASSDVIICVLGDGTDQVLDSANQITATTEMRIAISYRVA